MIMLAGCNGRGFNGPASGSASGGVDLAGMDRAVNAGDDFSRQFFISFARCWRKKYREPLLRQLILTSRHAPSEYRADSVRNIDPRYEAFSVKSGQKLYLAPGDRVRLW